MGYSTQPIKTTPEQDKKIYENALRIKNEIPDQQNQYYDPASSPNEYLQNREAGGQPQQPLNQQKPVFNPDTSYWNNYNNLIQERNKYIADPTYVSPYGTDFDQVDAAIKYYEYRSNGEKDPLKVQKLTSDDNFWKSDSIKMSSWKTPDDVLKERAEAEAAAKIQQPAAAQPDLLKSLPKTDAQKYMLSKLSTQPQQEDFNNWDTIQKLQYLTIPGTNENVKNVPSYAKLTQPIISIALSAGIGGVVAGLVGLPAAAGVAVIGGLLAFEAYSGINIPGMDKILELADSAIILAEKAVGTTDLAYKNLKDNNDVINLANLYGEFKDLWSDDMTRLAATKTFEAGAGGKLINYGYNALENIPEVYKEVKSWITGENYNLKENLFNPRMVARTNMGNPTPEMLPEEAYGANALSQMADLFRTYRDTLLSNGVEEKEAIAQTETFADQLTSAVFGTTGQMRDFYLQLVDDPTNLIPFLTGRSAEWVGKKTNNEALVRAAQSTRGPMWLDLTPQPVQSIAEFLSRKSQSAGIVELKNAYKREIGFIPASERTWFQTKLAGINPDNTLKEFDPYRPQNIWQNIAKLWHRDPAAMAYLFSNTMFNSLNVSLESAGEDPIKMKEVVDIFVKGEPISDDSRLAKFADTAIFNTVKKDIAYAMQQNQEKIYSVLDNYEIFSSNRAVLKEIADIVGYKKQGDVIALYNKSPEVLMKMIQNNIGDRTVGGLKANDPLFKQAVDKIKVFTGEDAQNWDIRQVIYDITNYTADIAGKQIAQKYGIKENSIPAKLTDIMKKSQGLLLLGLSPSYLMNNVINNLVTRAAVGVFGYMTPDQIDSKMARFRIKPERMNNGSSLGSEFGLTNDDTSALGNASKTFEKIQKGDKGILSSLNNIVSGFNKIGIFSRFSNRLEVAESRQAYAIGMEQYWGKMWKRGKGFRMMDKGLEQALGEDITELVYSAIEAGYNMDEIMDGVFNTISKPTIDMKKMFIDSIKSVATDMTGSAFDELFVKTGLWDVIEKEINDTPPNRWAAVAEDIIKQIDDRNMAEMNKSLLDLSRSIQTQTTLEGYPRAISCFTDMMQEYSGLRSETIRQKNNLFKERKNKKMLTKEFDARYQALAKYENQQWEYFYRKTAIIFKGILSGIGVKDKEAAEFMKAYEDTTRAYKEFYKFKLESFQRYRIEARKNYSNINEPDPYGKAWEAHSKEDNDAYENLLIRVKNNQLKMYQNFIDGYKKSIDPQIDTNPLNQKLMDILQLQEKLYQEQRNLYAKLGNEDLTNDSRTAAYDDYAKGEADIRNAIQTRYKEIAHFMNLYPPKFNPDPNANNGMGPNSTFLLQEQYEESTNIENDLSNLIDTYMTRDQVYQNFLKSKDRVSSRLSMAALDAMAAYWEKAHPGKDFWQDMLKQRPWDPEYYYRTLESKSPKSIEIESEFDADFSGEIVHFMKGDKLYFERATKTIKGIDMPYILTIESDGETTYKFYFSKDKIIELPGMLKIDPDQLSKLVGGAVQNPDFDPDAQSITDKTFTDEFAKQQEEIGHGEIVTEETPESKRFNSVEVIEQKNRMSTAPGEFYQYIDGSTAIKILDSASLNDMLNEIMHSAQRAFTLEQREDIARFKGYKDNAEYEAQRDKFFNEKMSKEDANTFRFREELLANAFEDYWLDGVAPTKHIAKVFQIASQILYSIYKTIRNAYRTLTGTALDKPFTSHDGRQITLRSIFDTMFDKETLYDQEILPDLEMASASPDMVAIKGNITPGYNYENDLNEGKFVPFGSVLNFNPVANIRELADYKLFYEALLINFDYTASEAGVNPGNKIEMKNFKNYLLYRLAHSREEKTLAKQASIDRRNKLFLVGEENVQLPVTGKGPSPKPIDKAKKRAANSYYLTPDQIKRYDAYLESETEFNGEKMTRMEYFMKGATYLIPRPPQNNYAIPLKGTYMRADNGFIHGEHQIVAQVFHDGKLVAYLPYDMKYDLVNNEGEDILSAGRYEHPYPVLGVDVDKPENIVILKDGKVRSIVPGDPFERPAVTKRIPLGVSYSADDVYTKIGLAVLNPGFNLDDWDNGTELNWTSKSESHLVAQHKYMDVINKALAQQGKTLSDKPIALYNSVWDNPSYESNRIILKEIANIIGYENEADVINLYKNDPDTLEQIIRDKIGDKTLGGLKFGGPLFKQNIDKIKVFVDSIVNPQTKLENGTLLTPVSEQERTRIVWQMNSLLRDVDRTFKYVKKDAEKSFLNDIIANIKHDYNVDKVTILQPSQIKMNNASADPASVEREVIDWEALIAALQDKNLSLDKFLKMEKVYSDILLSGGKYKNWDEFVVRDEKLYRKQVISSDVLPEQQALESFAKHIANVPGGLNSLENDSQLEFGNNKVRDLIKNKEFQRTVLKNQTDRLIGKRYGNHIVDGYVKSKKGLVGFTVSDKSLNPFVITYKDKPYHIAGISISDPYAYIYLVGNRTHIVRLHHIAADSMDRIAILCNKSMSMLEDMNGENLGKKKFSLRKIAAGEEFNDANYEVYGVYDASDKNSIDKYFKIFSNNKRHVPDYFELSDLYSGILTRQDIEESAASLGQPAEDASQNIVEFGPSGQQQASQNVIEVFAGKQSPQDNAKVQNQIEPQPADNLAEASANPVMESQQPIIEQQNYIAKKSNERAGIKKGDILPMPGRDFDFTKSPYLLEMRSKDRVRIYKVYGFGLNFEVPEYSNEKLIKLEKKFMDDEITAFYNTDKYNKKERIIYFGLVPTPPKESDLFGLPREFLVGMCLFRKSLEPIKVSMVMNNYDISKTAKDFAYLFDVSSETANKAAKIFIDLGNEGWDKVTAIFSDLEIFQEEMMDNVFKKLFHEIYPDYTPRAFHVEEPEPPKSFNGLPDDFDNLAAKIEAVRRYSQIKELEEAGLPVPEELYRKPISDSTSNTNLPTPSAQNSIQEPQNLVEITPNQQHQQNTFKEISFESAKKGIDIKDTSVQNADNDKTKNKKVKKIQSVIDPQQGENKILDGKTKQEKDKDFIVTLNKIKNNENIDMGELMSAFNHSISDFGVLNSEGVYDLDNLSDYIEKRWGIWTPKAWRRISNHFGIKPDPISKEMGSMINSAIEKHKIIGKKIEAESENISNSKQPVENNIVFEAKPVAKTKKISTIIKPIPAPIQLNPNTPEDIKETINKLQNKKNIKMPEIIKAFDYLSDQDSTEGIDLINHIRRYIGTYTPSGVVRIINHTKMADTHKANIIQSVLDEFIKKEVVEVKHETLSKAPDNLIEVSQTKKAPDNLIEVSHSKDNKEVSSQNLSEAPTNLVEVKPTNLVEVKPSNEKVSDHIYIDRDEFEKIISKFYGKDIVKAWMNYQDSIMENWMEENPGKDPYKEALKVIRLAMVAEDKLPTNPIFRQSAFLDEKGKVNKAIKGLFKSEVDGDAIVLFTKHRDFSTLSHEMAHLFIRVLDQNNLDNLAKYFGYKDGKSFMEIQDRFWNHKLSQEERKKVIKENEKFARGHELYVTRGIAPTPELATVFQKFSDWMLKIYKSIIEVVKEKLKIDPTAKEFIFDGETLDIAKTVNGVSLINIFEDMVEKKAQSEVQKSIKEKKPSVKKQNTPNNNNPLEHPVEAGGTGDIDPVAFANYELSNQYIRPAIEKFFDNYKKEYERINTPEYKDKFSKVNNYSQDVKANLAKYLDSIVGQDMASSKYKAMAYAENQRDGALLNYRDRYGFDNILTAIAPYQFWYTRSAMNWIARMADRPQWFSMYAKLRRLQEKNKKKYAPSRTNGMLGFLMPYLPDQYSDSMWFDPISKLLPMDTFFSTSRRVENDAAIVTATALRIIDNWYEDGEISKEDYDLAKSQNPSGPKWEQAMAEAELESGKDLSGLNVFSQYMGLPIAIDWYRKIAKGQGDKIYNLPSSRFGNAIKTLTQDTGLETIGELADDVLTAPEKALRKAYGLEYNEFGDYGNTQLKQQLAKMVVEGLCNSKQALDTMAEKQGPLWDEAMRRQSRENAMMIPGYATFDAAKSLAKGESSALDVFASIPALTMANAFGVRLVSDQEKEIREDRDLYNKAAEDYAAGDKEAFNRFYKENPGFEVSSIGYIKDDEELLRRVLYNSINDIYYDLPIANQNMIKEKLSPEFEYSILKKETRNYKDMDLDTLAGYAQSLRGNLPNVPKYLDPSKITQTNIPMYSDTVSAHYQEYLDLDKQYPGAKEIQNIGYNLDKTERGKFFAMYPIVGQYNDARKALKDKYPDLKMILENKSDYYDEKALYNSYRDMSEQTRKQLETYAIADIPMKSWAQTELKGLYNKYNTSYDLSYEDYLKQLANYK